MKRKIVDIFKKLFEKHSPHEMFYKNPYEKR